MAAQNPRLDVRLTSKHKKLIERAAGLLGQTISAFTIATLLREAEEIVERFGSPRLTDRARDTFLAALDRPPNPCGKLRKAAKNRTDKAAS